MRLPRKDGAFDMAQICEMADAFIESGGTYFDAAYVYEGAEAALCESVLKRYPRENVQIATKLNLHVADAPEQLDQQFNTSLERLGTGYVDFYLLHGINAKASKKAEELGAWEYVRDLKAKGLVRHAGFSFHGQPEDLEEILSKHQEAEFVQLQINYLDWNNPDVQSRRLYEIARGHGKPIIVMEPLQGGLLASEASPIAPLLRDAGPGVSMASWALRFAAQLEGVVVVLSGMSSSGQVADNISSFADIKPLTPDEQAVLDKAVEIINAAPRVACTDCRYCIGDCPSKIMIPSVIDIYNDYLIHNTTTNLSHGYRFVTMNGGKAGDCTACRSCESVCPQKLDIVDTLAKASALFDQA
jgi:predicted aldo/keto reductase-like oxidoreductase